MARVVLVHGTFNEFRGPHEPKCAVCLRGKTRCGRTVSRLLTPAGEL